MESATFQDENETEPNGWGRGGVQENLRKHFQKRHRLFTF